MTEESSFFDRFVDRGQLDYRSERATLATRLAQLKLERRRLSLTASAGPPDAQLEELELRIAELDQQFVAASLNWYRAQEEARRIAREAQARADAAYTDPVEMTDEEFKVEVDRLLAGVFEDAD